MRLFKLLPDTQWAPQTGTLYVDGTWGWSLPGVTCDVCGDAWGEYGLSYPTIDLSDALFARELRRPRNVPIAEYLALRRKLESSIPAGTYVRPGTSFGPVHAVGKGEHGDVLWLSKSYMLLEEKALQALRKKGVRLRAGPADVRWPGKKLAFWEIEARPSVVVRNITWRKPACPRCESMPVTAPDAPLVAADSVPRDMDVARGREILSWQFGTERLAAAVKELGLTGLTLGEVEVL